jgi:hypothetical protein
MTVGLNLSTTSSLEDMSAIVIASAVANVEPAGPVAALVHQVPIEQGAKQVNLPFFGRQEAVALYEGVAVPEPQQAGVAVRQLTATEHGILSFVSNRLQRQNNENILSTVGMMQGNAVGRLRDTDVIALFASVSKTIGAAGAANDLDDISGAISYLLTDNDAVDGGDVTKFGPAPGTINVAIHPEQLRRLATASIPLSSGAVGSTLAPSGLSEEIIKSYWRGNDPLFGSPIWVDGNIARDSSGDSIGCAFVEMAFSLAIAQEIDSNDDTDIRLRGTEIVTVAEWGELENVDTWACELIGATDAQT